MHNSTAVIIRDNAGARDVVAAGGRISTQEGTALGIFQRSGDAEKDLKLIRRVVGSGHLSVLEHHALNIAFNDVSVLVEQFIIEFRLASFTVKSRRYVNFSQAGYVLPEDVQGELAQVWSQSMQGCFDVYEKLLQRGIPREDARFVLPYALRSNFLVTVNLRELLHMIECMRYGRGRRFSEIRQLGKQLSEQLEGLYPGLVDALIDVNSGNNDAVRECAPVCGGAARAEVRLLSATDRPERLLQCANEMAGCDPGRERALELLHYCFEISGISLACLTHITRHRMLTPIIPPVGSVWMAGRHIVPESIRSDEAAMQIYTERFGRQYDSLMCCLNMGMDPAHMGYFALSGMTTDILLDVNARELKHFFALRTCSRAQWEIQEVAVEMLSRLVSVAPELFGRMGPSCAILGHCPEGRMSCGNPVRGFDELIQKRKGDLGR